MLHLEVILGLQKLLHAVVRTTSEAHIELVEDADTGEYQEKYVGN